MQVEISEMDFQIAASLLKDYVEEKQEQLVCLQQQFNREYVAQRETDLHAWLLNYSKQLTADVQHLHEGACQLFTQIKMPFLYTFFDQCLNILAQNSKHLAQALAERINRCIDFSPDPSSITAKINTVIASTDRDEKDIVEKNKGLTGRDLESLDYFLNLLSYEDNKSYEEYKSHCDRLLLQRQSFENIQASNASRQILQTANCIHDIMEDTDKVFQESYLAKYMEFKSYLTQLPRPDQLHSIFKEEMEKSTKQRFFEGMARAIMTLARVGRDQQKKQMTSSFMQTVEEIPKYKAQEKLQGLLLQQKRNNQKLNNQLLKLKRNSSSSFEDRGELQKRLEKQEFMRKQLENKYKILQNLYNAKCIDEQRQKGKKNTANNIEHERKTLSISIQAGQCCLSKAVQSQTDSDFYYYFQSTKIAELQKRTDELQKLLNHKEYVLQEMQAIKTFRDNFKSKKEIYSTQVKTQRNISLGKSLHYLQEDDEIYDDKEDKRNGKSSVDEAGKAISPLDNSGKNQYVFRKKNQKKTEIIKNKPYFAFNDKIEDMQEDLHLSKSQHEQTHQISLRSILKMGNNTFKVDKGIQTDNTKTEPVIQSAIQSKNQKQRYNERDTIKQKMRETIKINLRQSQSSQNSKSIRQKIQPISKEARKSNFISFQNLNEQKKVVEAQIAVPANQTFTGRQSPFGSTLNRKMTPDKPKYLMRLSKWNETKVNTLNNEVLHVNNSLNLNFFQPLTTSPKISAPKGQGGKSTTKYEQFVKPKKLKKLL